MNNKENIKSAYKQWIKGLDAFQKVVISEDRFTQQAFKAGWQAALKSIYFDPDRQMALIWSIEDVKSLRNDLTDEQCMEVLRKTSHEYDSDIGVNWNTLQIWADELFPEGGE